MLNFQYLILFAACSFSSCAVQPVAIRQLENFALENVFTRPEVSFELVIHNPNRVGVTITGVETHVELGGTRIAGIALDRQTRVPANSEIRIPLRAEPDFSAVKNLLLKKGKLPREGITRGELRVRKFIFSKRIPFREKYKL